MREISIFLDLYSSQYLWHLDTCFSIKLHSMIIKYELLSYSICQKSSTVDDIGPCVAMKDFSIGSFYFYFKNLDFTEIYEPFT